MPVEDTKKWIQKDIVPNILKNDFEGATIKNAEERVLESMKDNWASEMFEINLLLTRHAETFSASFLLKVMNESEIVRKQMKSDKQFFNEIHFYSSVSRLLTSRVPSCKLKFKFENLYPKCCYSYYRSDKKPDKMEDAVLVLENLKVRDFKLGNRLSLDFPHCSLSFRCLGVFHAFSYFIKERDLDAFMNVAVKPIQETNYDPKDEREINAVFDTSQSRVIEALSEELPEDDPKLIKLRNFASRKSFDSFTDFVQPREPLAVLCHGDFLRNNVLFRYENGEPVEMKFIDFQTIRYASPAIDLSLLICMNTTHELRKNHLDELLKQYHASLIDTLAALLEKPKDELEEKYSFENFLSDFRRHAAYGYLISVEFLAWMYAESDELEEFMKLNRGDRGSPKFCEALRKLGGDAATRQLVQLANDLLEYQCFSA